MFKGVKETMYFLDYGEYFFSGLFFDSALLGHEPNDSDGIFQYLDNLTLYKNQI